MLASTARPVSRCLAAVGYAVGLQFKKQKTNKKTAAGIFGVSVQHLLLPRVWAGASWRGFLPWLLMAALGQAQEAGPGPGEVLRWQGAVCPLARLLTSMLPSSAVLLPPNPLDDMKMCFLFTFCPSQRWVR